MFWRQTLTRFREGKFWGVVSGMPFLNLGPRAELRTQFWACRSCLCRVVGNQQEHSWNRKGHHLQNQMKMIVFDLPGTSRRTGGGCPGRKPLMTAWEIILLWAVMIDQHRPFLILFETEDLVVRHLPHLEDICATSFVLDHYSSLPDPASQRNSLIETKK